MLVIKSFKDKATEDLFKDLSVARFKSFERPARRKLLYFHRARTLKDLAVPPGNHLESLKVDRLGQHSIRIHERWRLCFRWEDGSAYDVEIVNYH